MSGEGASTRRRSREAQRLSVTFMAHLVLLQLHSWVRWAVVASVLAVATRAVLALLRTRAWTDRDALVARVWVGATDLQLALGLAMYFSTSAIAEVTRADPSAAWNDVTIRFFGILHPLTMFGAVVLTHATWIWARRTRDPRARFRRLAVGAALTAVLVLAAIPWPSPIHGRPLFRT